MEIKNFNKQPGWNLININFIRAPIGVFFGLITLISTAILTCVLTDKLFESQKDLQNFGENRYYLKSQNNLDRLDYSIILVAVFTWLTSSLIYITGFLSLISHRRNGSGRLAFYSLLTAAMLLSCGFFYQKREVKTDLEFLQDNENQNEFDLQMLYYQEFELSFKSEMTRLLLWIESFLYFSYWGYFMSFGFRSSTSNRPIMHTYIQLQQNSKDAISGRNQNRNRRNQYGADNFLTNSNSNNNYTCNNPNEDLNPNPTSTKLFSYKNPIAYRIGHLSK